MRYVVVAGPAGDGVLQAVDDRGGPAGPAERVDPLAAAVAARESAEHPRWVWPATDEVYPDLLAAGVPVDRCVDLALTEGILLGTAGRWGEPRSLGAAWARLA
ncbi:MAG TPA: bifunctional 3'-5' exonuclease/DNA polymerase, partial [Mycobacteriales bacterium]|nr:bifunctional 3'-5' exonuclease/DNA polymerase [Mycobacteriales bacterium]